MGIGSTNIGNGPEKILALHTWLADHATYTPMFPYLDQNRFSYAFVNYRGYGESRDLSGQHTLAEIEHDVIDLADALGWNKFHLIGNSMGGHVAQHMAASCTSRVKSVVLLNPVPVCGAPLEGDTLALFEGAAENPENRGTIMHLATGERYSMAWRRAMVTTSSATSSPRAVADYLKAWTNTDNKADVIGCPTPINVLLGEHDPIITPDGMRQSVLQWFPNAELHTVKNAGHFPALEVPCHTATTAEAFFDRFV